MSTYKTTIEIDSGEGDEEVAIVVQYQACPFIAGSTDGRGGPKIEPDEPAHIEIESVTLPDGRFFELSKKERERLEEEICNDIARNGDDGPDPDRYRD